MKKNIMLKVFTQLKIVKAFICVIMAISFLTGLGIYIYNKPYIELNRIIENKLKEERLSFQRENNLNDKTMTLSMVMNEKHFECVTTHIKLLVNRTEALILLESLKYRKFAKVFDVWIQFLGLHREKIEILDMLCKMDISKKE